MKLSYFPYLPNSRNEDNKRYKYIRDMMEKNPFTYHKRKNISSSLSTLNSYMNNFNDIQNNINENKARNFHNSVDRMNNNNYFNGNNINQELLFFQKANERYMDSYNNFMKQKSSTIENNAQRYLNYIIQNKRPRDPNTNLSNDLSEKTNNIMSSANEFKKRKNFFYENKSASDFNILYNRPKNDIIESKVNNNTINDNNNDTIETEKKNFIPNNIKARGSDITNPFFYDRIAKEIIKKNQEVSKYNLKESEIKYNKMKKLPKYSEDKLAIAPGKRNSPEYYTLGESVLDKNPILNKGDYSPSFSRNYKYFSRQENIFGHYY